MPVVLLFLALNLLLSDSLTCQSVSQSVKSITSQNVLDHAHQRTCLSESILNNEHAQVKKLELLNTLSCSDKYSKIQMFDF